MELAGWLVYTLLTKSQLGNNFLQVAEYCVSLWSSRKVGFICIYLEH
jgi:hypothetical protein